MALRAEQRECVLTYFIELQERLLEAFLQVNGGGQIQGREWVRGEGGGGTMGVLRGEVVEKAAANRSAVHGTDYPGGLDLKGELKGKPFSAAGVSTICHMRNPFAPIGHMNVRLLEVGDTFWFGGGADLTPCFPFEEDTKEFHLALRAACDSHPCQGMVSYDKFSKWCDEYFYIPHRKSVRGVGGIFFDYLQGDFDALFAFLRCIGDTYAEVYPRILMRRKDHPFTPEEKEQQLYWRGRYAEYNLIYDRGTKFGLMTGGNTEAIFVSLPPVVKW